MSRRPHIFMDDTQYRSAASIHYGFSIGNPPGISTYGYGNAVGAEYRYAATYMEPALDSYTAEAAWQQRMRQIYLEQSGVRWYTDNIIRRANLNAAIANGALMWHPNMLVYVQPMLAPTGAYPPGFADRRQVHDFLHMSNIQLEQIMAAYHLTPGRPQYIFALRDELLARRHGYTGPGTHRIANLIALFDYLGAHRVAGQLRLQAA